MTVTRRSMLTGLASVAAGAALWLPNAHRVFRPRDREAMVLALLERHLALWEGASQADIVAMRDANPEWDFMGRTFLVLALADLALAHRSLRDRHLAVIDRIVADTVAAEAEHGQRYFLMGYADANPWVHPSGRSLFVDGEIALMVAARLAVSDDPALRADTRERFAHIVAQMSDGPIGSAESYPNECWTFCNTTALVALRLADRAYGTDHRDFVKAWLARAREHLVDPGTGMLVSSYTLDGRHLDGPEGSSIWFSAHNLRWVDGVFAGEQYARARQQLGRQVLGFGYAREWPASWEGPADIDSGPIVPVLNASAGSSGLALVAAGAFRDDLFGDRLVASLNLAAFPQRNDGQLSYTAGNQVGDAVLLYALCQGHLLDGGERS